MYAPSMQAFAIAIIVISSLLGCGGPSRTSYAQYPGSPPTFDRATSSPEALALAEKVLAAAGGAAAWERAKQIRWKQAISREGKPMATGEQVWDRWNARHWARVDRGEGAGVVVMYELYGDFASGYIQSKTGNRQLLPSEERAEGVKVARKSWARDVTATCMPFLMAEPGVKLEHLGTVKDGETEYQDLKITFAANDPARAGMVVHAYADANAVIGRLEIETTGGERFGYHLSNWTEVNGLKFPGTRKNLGSDEVVTIEEIKVSDPDDSLFIPPVS